MALSRSMKNFMQSHIAKAPTSAFGQTTRKASPAQRVGQAVNQQRSLAQPQGSFGIGQMVNQAVNKRGALNAPKTAPVQSTGKVVSTRGSGPKIAPPVASKRGMGSGPKIAPPSVQPPAKNRSMGSGPKVQGTFGFLGQQPQRAAPGRARPAMGFRGMRRR